MSMRMLPDSRISPVVLPSAPMFSSPGATSLFSTASKSIPLRVPKAELGIPYSVRQPKTRLSQRILVCILVSTALEKRVILLPPYPLRDDSSCCK